VGSRRSSRSDESNRWKITSTWPQIMGLSCCLVRSDCCAGKYIYKITINKDDKS
jgi:aminopeptidase C